MNGYKTLARAEIARLAAEKRTGWRFFIYEYQNRFYLTSYDIDGYRKMIDGTLVSSLSMEVS